jgi:hypothetical protein
MGRGLRLCEGQRVTGCNGYTTTCAARRQIPQSSALDGFLHEDGAIAWPTVIFLSADYLDQASRIYCKFDSSPAPA